MSNNETLTAVEIAKRVREKQISASEVVAESLKTIEAKDAELNAFNLVTAERAMSAARALDDAIAKGEQVGPLAGVPIALKDNLCTNGVDTTCSSRILEGWKPPYDATVVERVTAAGAITVGKTNLDEFAMGSSTENSAFGVTRNPHDTTRVAGGSSGGSAAAVASGMTPIGFGSDTGGSIRQPASFCGVVGIKPTYGLVSRYGLIAFASSLDQVGPFGTTVRDAATLLEAVAGHDPRDSTSLNQPVQSLTKDIDSGVKGLRVGIVKELLAEGVAPDVAAAVRRAVDVLSANGAEISEVSVPAVQYGVTAYYLIAPAEASSNLARFDGVRYGLRKDAENIFEMYNATRQQGFGAEVKRRIMLGTYALSAGYYDAYYGKAQRVRTLITQDFAKAYESCDVLISPTAPTTAFTIGEKTSDPLAMYLNDVCTIPTNLAGHPAMSVPFGKDSNNLPIGVQLLGPALSEATLVRAGAVLEANA